MCEYGNAHGINERHGVTMFHSLPLPVQTMTLYKLYYGNINSVYYNINGFI